MGKRNDLNRTPVNTSEHKQLCLPKANKATDYPSSNQDLHSNSSNSTRDVVKRRISFRSFVNDKSKKSLNRTKVYQVTVSKVVTSDRGIKAYEKNQRGISPQVVTSNQKIVSPWQYASVLHPEKGKKSQQIYDEVQQSQTQKQTKEQQMYYVVNEPEAQSVHQSTNKQSIAEECPLKTTSGKNSPTNPEATNESEMNPKIQKVTELVIKTDNLQENKLDLQDLKSESVQNERPECKTPTPNPTPPTPMNPIANPRSLSTQKQLPQFPWQKQKQTQRRVGTWLPQNPIQSNKIQDHTYQPSLTSPSQAQKNSNEKSNLLKKKNSLTPIGVYQRPLRPRPVDYGFPYNSEKKSPIRYKNPLSRTSRAQKNPDVKKVLNLDPTTQKSPKNLQIEPRNYLQQTKASQAKKLKTPTNLQINSARQGQTPKIPQVQPLSTRSHQNPTRKLQIPHSAAKAAQNAPPILNDIDIHVSITEQPKQVDKAAQSPEKSKSTDLIKSGEKKSDEKYSGEKTQLTAEKSKSAEMQVPSRNFSAKSEKEPLKITTTEQNQEKEVEKKDQEQFSADDQVDKDKTSEAKKEEQPFEIEDIINMKKEKVSNTEEQKPEMIVLKQEIISKEALAQKIMNSQSQDLFKDVINIEVDKKDVKSEFMEDKDEKIRENSIMNLDIKQVQKAKAPMSDMLSWHNQYPPSLNMLQKDEKDESSQLDTVRTPQLANFGLNSPQAATPFKKDEPNYSAENQNRILLERKSLNTIDQNQSEMHIQENPFSPPIIGSSTMSKENESKEVTDESMEKKQQIIRDSDSIIVKIEPELTIQSKSTEQQLGAFKKAENVFQSSTMNNENNLDNLISIDDQELRLNQLPEKNNNAEIQHQPPNVVAQQRIVNLDRPQPIITKEDKFTFLDKTSTGEDLNLQQIPLKSDPSVLEIDTYKSKDSLPTRNAFNALNNTPMDYKTLGSSQYKLDSLQQSSEKIGSLRLQKNKMDNIAENSDSDDNQQQSLLAEMNASFSTKLLKQRMSVPNNMIGSVSQFGHSKSPIRREINPYIRQKSRVKNRDGEQASTVYSRTSGVKSSTSRNDMSIVSPDPTSMHFGRSFTNVKVMPQSPQSHKPVNSLKQPINSKESPDQYSVIQEELAKEDRRLQMIQSENDNSPEKSQLETFKSSNTKDYFQNFSEIDPKVLKNENQTRNDDKSLARLRSSSKQKNSELDIMKKIERNAILQNSNKTSKSRENSSQRQKSSGRRPNDMGNNQQQESQYYSQTPPILENQSEPFLALKDNEIKLNQQQPMHNSAQKSQNQRQDSLSYKVYNNGTDNRNDNGLNQPMTSDVTSAKTPNFLTAENSMFTFANTPQPMSKLMTPQDSTMNDFNTSQVIPTKNSTDTDNFQSHNLEDQQTASKQMNSQQSAQCGEQEIYNPFTPPSHMSTLMPVKNFQKNDTDPIVQSPIFCKENNNVDETEELLVSESSNYQARKAQIRDSSLMDIQETSKQNQDMSMSQQQNKNEIHDIMFDQSVQEAPEPIQMQQEAPPEPQFVKLNLNELPLEPTYYVSFKMPYKVNYGEEIAIVGNIPELGNWTDTSRARLRWTTGDVWVLDDIKLEVNEKAKSPKRNHGSFFFDDFSQPKKKRPSYFQYKYCVIDSHSRQIVRLEKGPNRIADLNLKYFEVFDQVLFEDHIKMQEYVSAIMSYQPEYMTFEDNWEMISVNFSMYYPLKDGEVLRIFGDTLQLGNWSCKIPGYNDKPGELEAKLMAPMNRQIQWLTGEMVTPFEYQVNFSLDKMPQRLKYKYSVHNAIAKRTVWEREPTRELQVLDPNEYKGELSQQRSNLWRNVFPVFIVNGHVEKADANFVGDMRFDKIGKTSLWLGPYPQTERDIDLLHQAGITGVFNVQTHGDMSFRGVRQDQMMQYYKQLGINAVHFPIQDFNEHELTSHLFEAAKILNDMINNKRQIVYVHCTAGMGRAPACVLSYLCLYKKVNGWQDPYNVDRFVKSYRKVSVPNMNAVCNVVQWNRGFQNQQHERIVE